MLPIRTILHPTDLSVYSEAAFGLSLALARDFGARLIVLHVHPPLVAAYGDLTLVESPAVIRKKVKERRLRLAAPDLSVPVEQRLEEGLAAEEILAVALETRADLIVMGTHGRRGVKRLLRGSVAEQVVRQAACPVVTVRAAAGKLVPRPESQAREVVRF